jgi:hypothetical protein
VSELFNKTFTFVEKYVIVRKTCKTLLLGGVFFATGREGKGVYLSQILASKLCIRSGWGNWARHIALASQKGRGNECGIISDVTIF